MPSVGTPASNRPSGTGGAPGSYTEAGPPDKMIAFGRLASISATGMVEGTISLNTLHSRTRRAMSCAYCAPKSTTRTMSCSGVTSVRLLPSARDPDPERQRVAEAQGGVHALRHRAWVEVGEVATGVDPEPQAVRRERGTDASTTPGLPYGD